VATDTAQELLGLQQQRSLFSVLITIITITIVGIRLSGCALSRGQRWSLIVVVAVVGLIVVAVVRGGRGVVAVGLSQAADGRDCFSVKSDTAIHQS
jgi:predicted membrane channel-forming protein YqfA (hemolysin III family)